jgi:AraC family transcriptional regulator of adaptative response / DNA-3-methyladenine glycosylase II
MMKLTKEQSYQVIKSSDARFDGKLFVGVKSTGIYCRPVCRVPAPKFENCVFFEKAYEAEEAGYRPCLRCRPELAPQYSEFSQRELLIPRVLEYFKTLNYTNDSIQEAGTEFGITARHLRRIFKEEIGISPKEYILTQRLLRAKMLLADTELSVDRVSELVGFGSVSRLRETMKQSYGLSPKQIRKKKNASGDYFQLSLSYRPPYRWDVMMAFLQQRAIPFVEEVTLQQEYRRTLCIRKDEIEYKGWIELSADESANKVQLKISHSLERVMFEVVEKVKTMFDLNADPEYFPQGIDQGIRLPGCMDLFEMSVGCILGQQITVSAATTIAGRLAKGLGTKAKVPWGEDWYYFPQSKDLLSETASDTELLTETLGRLGVIQNRSRTILELAKLYESSRGMQGYTTEERRKVLIETKGIGPWTANYILMRGFSWPDSFLTTDLGVKKALIEQLHNPDGHSLSDLISELSKYKGNKLYEGVAETWAGSMAPWRSYLTIGLWNGLLDWSVVDDLFYHDPEMG